METGAKQVVSCLNSLQWVEGPCAEVGGGGRSNPLLGSLGCSTSRPGLLAGVLVCPRRARQPPVRRHLERRTTGPRWRRTARTRWIGLKVYGAASNEPAPSLEAPRLISALSRGVRRDRTDCHGEGVGLRSAMARHLCNLVRPPRLRRCRAEALRHGHAHPSQMGSADVDALHGDRRRAQRAGSACSSTGQSADRRECARISPCVAGSVMHHSR